MDVPVQCAHLLLRHLNLK